MSPLMSRPPFFSCYLTRKGSLHLTRPLRRERHTPSYHRVRCSKVCQRLLHSHHPWLYGPPGPGHALYHWHSGHRDYGPSFRRRQRQRSLTSESWFGWRVVSFWASHRTPTQSEQASRVSKRPCRCRQREGCLYEPKSPPLTARNWPLMRTWTMSCERTRIIRWSRLHLSELVAGRLAALCHSSLHVFCVSISRRRRHGAQ